MIASLGSAWEGKACGRFQRSKEKAAAQGLDAVKQIIKVNHSVLAEISLGGHDECLPELGERETSRLFDGFIKIHARKGGMHSDEVLTAKLRRWIGKCNDPIKATGPAENGRIKRQGFIGACDGYNSLAAGHAIKIVEQLLQAYLGLAWPCSWEASVDILQ